MRAACRCLLQHQLYAELAAMTWLLAGCSGMQSALDPASPQATHIRDLWWLMLGVCSVVLLCVTGFLLYAIWHTRRGDAVTAEAQVERRLTIGVAGATAVTIVILFVLLVASISAGRGLALPAADPLTIEVTGHQWWWEVRYVDPVPSQQVTTANEIHIPVGRLVLLKLTSRDVIHSFWAPNLQGKKDLIPGHMTSLSFQADKPGVYRGQCAEFCGYQHAYMAFLIVAEPPDQFAAWLEHQRQPAAQPADGMQQTGQEVFVSVACGLCHTIQGTLAGGKVAPDLTHLSSRRTIAAGTLPNTRGHLAAWIIDPQNIKPGNKMPPNNLNPGDLQALLAYLESLK
jgi:cytochrome c oxidase subunit II